MNFKPDAAYCELKTQIGEKERRRKPTPRKSTIVQSPSAL
jgi:hypothetical protein